MTSKMTNASSPSLLQVQNLKVHFPVLGGIFGRPVAKVYAVDGVSLDVQKGETVGLVGESGCGKSTLGRAILRLYEPTEGTVSFKGQNLAELDAVAMKNIRRQLQMVFQDPFGSLDPRMTVERILTEPYRLHGIGKRSEQEAQATELLKLVGLKSDDLKKYPHEFSGGQRQRIGIARALALKPELLIADEPVAALDVSIQAQVLNLMNDLKRRFALTYIFISHDLAMVKYLSDRVAVMYLGKIVEWADSEDLYARPRHPYTRALMSAILEADPSVKRKRQILQGDVPSPLQPPTGCAFHPRCPHATDQCRQETPQIRNLANATAKAHWVSCHLTESLKF